MSTAPKPFAALTLPEWADYMREILQREGRAVRSGGANLTIEAKSLTTDQWYSLPLPPDGKPQFTTTTDRDQALARILEPNAAVRRDPQQ
jgi:hypothetical protein